MRLFILFLCCSPLLLNAQERDKNTVLYGKITADSNDIEGIHIINLSSLTATITKKDGTFSINGKVKDTLYISSVLYKDKKIVLTEKIIAEKKLKVHLKIKVNELEGVTLKPHNLTGNVYVDVLQSKTVYDSIRPSKLGLPVRYGKLPTKTERRLKRVSSGSLNILFALLSGEHKKIKKQLEWERENIAIERIRRQFDFSLYSKFLKIPEGKIEDFILFCVKDDAFASVNEANDAIKMLDFLNAKSAEYRKINGFE